MNALKRRLIDLEGPNGAQEYRRWTDERLRVELGKGVDALRLTGVLVAAKWDALARGESVDDELIVDLMAELSAPIATEETAR